MSSFQILTCCRAPTPWAARGLAEPTSTRAPGRPKTSFTSLPSEGPHAVRVSGESNPDLSIQSPARYLCASAAGYISFIKADLDIIIHKGPTVGLPRYRHFVGFFFKKSARPCTGLHFFGYSEKPPHFSRLYDAHGD